MTLAQLGLLIRAESSEEEPQAVDEESLADLAGFARMRLPGG